MFMVKANALRHFAREVACLKYMITGQSMLEAVSAVGLEASLDLS